MSVAEQVALDVAFGRFADSLDEMNTPDDSLIADFTRIGARLIRLQGRYGTISVQVPGSAEPVSMRAVAFTLSDPSASAKLVLAWEGLDAATFAVERALVLQSGGLETFLAPQLRFLDMTGGPTSGLYAGGGSLTFTGMAFTNGCAGQANTSTVTCRAGKVTAAGSGEVSRPNDLVGVTVDWDAAPLAAFELISK
jgi:hypothetical protein